MRFQDSPTRLHPSIGIEIGIDALFCPAALNATKLLEGAQTSSEGLTHRDNGENEQGGGGITLVRSVAGSRNVGLADHHHVRWIWQGRRH